MKYYNYTKFIDEESFKDFISFMNENTSESIVLYLNSSGGDVEIASTIKDVIESHKKITLVAAGRVCSSMFWVFYETNCKKRILPGARGMWHLGCWHLSLMPTGKGNSSEDEFIFKEMKKQELQDVKALCDKIGMSANDKKRVMKGEDVWFNTEQLEQFLKTYHEPKISRRTRQNPSGPRKTV